MSREADITLEKTLPNSIESERAVLGAILLDHKAIFPATEVLTAEDFYLESHREIFRAMLALAEEEISIDLFTVLEELRRCNKEEVSGGPAYLAALTDGLPRAINLEHYAPTVREKATSRQLIRLANKVMSRCFEGEERPAEILESAESEIFRIASREIRGGFQPASDLAGRALREIEEASKHSGPVTGPGAPAACGNQRDTEIDAPEARSRPLVRSCLRQNRSGTVRVGYRHRRFPSVAGDFPSQDPACRDA